MAGNEQPSEAERYGQGTEPTTGRRTVLQSLAATGAVGIGLGASSVARAQDGYIGTTVAAYRRLGEGLSRAEIIEQQNRAIAEYRAETGATEPVAVGAPEAWNGVDNDLDVVSYAIRVFPDGTSRYDAGVVTDDQPSAVVDRAHRNTEEFVERMRGSQAATTYATTSSDDGSSFEYVAGGGTDNEGCPEGTIRVESDVYEWQEDGSSRTIFATQTNFRSTPGHQVDDCNGRWYSGQTKTCQHQWSEADYTDPSLNTFKPRDERDGEMNTSFSISRGGAQVTWDYSQPDVNRKNRTGNVDTDWDYYLNKEEKYTHVWETGSECEFDRYQSTEKGDRIVDGYFKHKFYDSLNYGRKTKDVQDYYYYGYG